MTDEALFDDESAAVARTDERVLETGQTITGEVTRVIDGEEHVFLDNKYPYRDGSGEVVGVMGISRDITGRKRRERELQETNARLEAVIKASPDAIVAVDPEGRVTLWNPAAQRIFGWSAEEVVGRPLPFVPGDRADEYESFLEQLFDGEPLTGVETRRERADGSPVDVSLSAAPLCDSDGEVFGVMGVLEDVTERKAYERELEARSAALEESIDGVAILDDDLRFEFVNRAHAAMYGYDDPDALVGSSWRTCYGDAEADRLEVVCISPLGESGSWRGEATGLRADGSTFPHELSVTRLDDGRTICVVRDVTERKAYERELQRTKYLLQQAQQLSAVGAWELDLPAEDALALTWTEEVFRIHEVPPREDVDLDRWLSFFHPDDRARARAAVEAAVERGEPYDLEARLRTAEGTRRWVRAIGEPVRRGGEIVRIRGSIQDVTERRERERELERTRNLLEQAQQVARVGGWELDVREEPHEFAGTDEFYRIHGLSPKSEFDRGMALEFYHPADRDRMRAAIEAAIETGESFDEEARLSTAADRQRWIRVIAEPVVEDDEVVALRGSIQDITDRKEQELTLKRLHDVARGLLEADSTRAVADVVVDAAVDVLDLPQVAAYLLDDETGVLQPAAVSDRLEAALDGIPPSVRAGADSPLWEAYVSGTVREFDESAIADAGLPAEAITGGVLVPIGDHGVLVAASARGTVAPADRRVAETLVATMEAALHRIDTEADLRENEAELESQNRRLRRQIQINEIIRRVDQSLIGAGTREEVETSVCERLVESEDVAFAWVGAPTPRGESVVPRAWAGGDQEYLDAISLETDADATDPAVGTAVTGESTVVESVVEDVKSEPWRRHALVRDFSSVVTVPLELDEYRYGVLAVYGTEPGAFGELERTVFEELGESIANSINAVEARHALYADAFVELRLRFDATEDFLGQVAAETGARVEYVGLATHADDESRLFFEASGADAAEVEAALTSRYAVREHRLISDEGDVLLFEATVAADVLAGRLVSRGGVPRSMEADGDRLDVVVDVTTTADVREFVEMVREAHPSAELTGRRDVRRDVQTRQELVTDLFEGLTDRQIEVLRTAFFAGFFEWPRESTGEEVAELLDVSQPTVNRHVRHGLARLLEQLFEEEPPALAEAQ